MRTLDIVFFLLLFYVCVCAISIMLSWLVPHSSSSDWHLCAIHTQIRHHIHCDCTLYTLFCVTINLSLSSMLVVFSKTRCKNIDRQPFHLIWKTQQRQITIAWVWMTLVIGIEQKCFVTFGKMDVYLRWNFNWMTLVQNCSQKIVQ